MSKRNKDALTDQQELFCQEYLKDLNGTQAAIRAGYSEKTAQEQASRLLSNVMVQARLSELMKERSDRTKISADRVLEELASIGFMTLDGEKLIQQMVEALKNGIDPRTIPRPGYPDKIRALELLGKHKKLFTDKHEHSGPDGKPIETVNKSDLTDEQLEVRLAAMLLKSKGKTDAEV